MKTPEKKSATKHVSANTKVVYKRPEFLDLLSSNNFYTVSAIALVLGISSAFGFIDNPRKLKAVVDTLSYKVSIDHRDNQRMPYQVFQQERYDLSASADRKASNMHAFRGGKDFLLEKYNFSESFAKNKKPVAFSYDITSDKFWNDLSSSNIGKSQSDSHKDSYSDHTLNIQKDGAYLEKGDYKYSIAAELKRN